METRCPFCGGELTVHNPHWVDAFVSCTCTPHLFRMSEVFAHIAEKESNAKHQEL